MELGLIHIYCGNGKGKTTAAIGLAMRAYGRNKKVLLTQFLKDNDTGELCVTENLGANFITYIGQPVNKFIFSITEEEKEELSKEHTLRFKNVIDMADKENYDLLILDEIIASVNFNIIPLSEVIKFLKNKPSNLEVVLTGREPDKQLVELADYVSEIKAIKHPYNKGITMRIGIEK